MAGICRLPGEGALPWAGTFHAVANRLLRLHAESLGLDPGVTLLDREDSADLIDRLRHQQGLSGTREPFPARGPAWPSTPGFPPRQRAPPVRAIRPLPHAPHNDVAPAPRTPRIDVAARLRAQWR